MNWCFLGKTLIKLLNLTNNVYKFNSNGSETKKSGIKTTYWGDKTCWHLAGDHVVTQAVWGKGKPRWHMSTVAPKTSWHVRYISTQGRLARDHKSTQGTLARKYVRTKDTLAHQHVSTQHRLAYYKISTLGPLARKQVSTLGTLAHEHDFITLDTQISRLSAIYYKMQITNLKQLLSKI